KSLEAGEGRADGIPGVALLALTPADDAERELSACLPEAIAGVLVLRDGLLQERGCVVDGPSSGGHKAAAPRCVREHPLAPETRRVALPGIEDSNRLVHAVEFQQRLDVVGHPPALHRLAPTEPPRHSGGLAKALHGRAQIVPLQGDDAEDPEMDGSMQPELLLPELQRSLRMFAGEIKLTPVGGDSRQREVYPRHLEPVLDLNLMCAVGVLGRQTPAAAPQLDPGEPEESVRRPKLVPLAPVMVRALEQRAFAVDVIAYSEHVALRDDRLLKQLRIADGGRKVVGSRRVPRRLGIADGASEKREHRERTHPERVVVEAVGEVERSLRMRGRRSEAHFETRRPGEPNVD